MRRKTFALSLVFALLAVAFTFSQAQGSVVLDGIKAVLESGTVKTVTIVAAGNTKNTFTMQNIILS